MWTTFGQDHLTDTLEASFNAQRLPHALLLTGPVHVGKMSLALDIARLIICQEPNAGPCNACYPCRRIMSGNHTDVQIVCRENNTSNSLKKEISIQQIREVQKYAYLGSYEAHRRTIIIDSAEFLSEEAANSLLKLLEEPPAGILLILLCSWENGILPTLKSRCQRLKLKQVGRHHILEELLQRGADVEHANLLSRLAHGCPGWALNTLEDPSLLDQREAHLYQFNKVLEANLVEQFDYAATLSSMFFRDKDAVVEILNLWLSCWRDILLIIYCADDFVDNVDILDQLNTLGRRYDKTQVVSAIHSVYDTLTSLDENASPRLALEVMMANMPYNISENT